MYNAGVGMIILTSQKILIPEVVERKRHQPERVMMTTVYHVGGVDVYILINGNHSFAAAMEDDLTITNIVTRGKTISVFHACELFNGYLNAITREELNSDQILAMLRDRYNGNKSISEKIHMRWLQ